MCARFRLFGRNRRAATTFRDADHLQVGDGPGRVVRGLLREEGVDAGGWRITLITNLRLLGYVFNPASFYLCRDESGALRRVVVEVHNTYGQRHRYLLRQSHATARRPVPAWTRRSSCRHSSRPRPLLGSVRDEDTGVRLAIALRQDGAHLLSTSLVLRRRP